ncbi:MAG: DUF5615 family PIN-like protein [Spirochaetaceae bacterium]|nr:DUF5615 family PIN-like protein [Spirochaetaceae bacterium]
MASVRFFTDEQVSKAVIMGLRRRGVDVLTVPEAGTLGASEVDQLRRARDEWRVIFTHDDDFLRLAPAGTRHAGIVYATQDRPIGEIIRGLMLIHEVLEAEDMVGRVEYL